MMNKARHNTLSSRGNEGSSGIEMFRQAQHDKQPCHPERSEGSQQTIKTKKMMNKARHTTQVPQGKTPLSFGEGLGVRLLLLTTFFCSLFSIPGSAQNYDWDWAVSGGSPLGAKHWNEGTQHIYDIKIGSDNNYYFIASINGTFGNDPNGALLDGQPVKQYNAHLDSFTDIFLFSTTCDGIVRWSQAIGGKTYDQAYSLALDSKNNVYLLADTEIGVHYGRPYSVFFSPTDSVSFQTYQFVGRRNYLVKYDSNGQFQKKKELQDIPTMAQHHWSQTLDLFIDSKDILHFIIGLQGGTHLDGNVTVPTHYQMDYNSYIGMVMQYHLAKYNTDLDYISSIELPIPYASGFPIRGKTRFIYDENLNRYYLAGMRSSNLTGGLYPLTYNGKPFIERSYVLAINGTDGSEAWRREIYTPTGFSGKNQDMFTSIIVDPITSDVYVGGQIWKSFNAQNLKIYDPHNPTTTTYTFTPVPHTNLPMLIKFNSSGTVQWLKTPTAFAPNYSSNGQFPTKGLALRHNEVAFGSSDPYFVWDGFSQNNPVYYQPKPRLLRFNKNTGQTIGTHDIKGFEYVPSGTTAVAVDNDGNYVVGGTFKGGLFTDGGKVPVLSSVSSNYSFFAAKLAASVCGTAVSTEEFNSLQLNVYPNPTNDVINIETDEQLSNYIIYDVSGRQIQNGNFENNNQINLQNVNNGTYFIKVTTVQGNSGTVKVVKK